MGTTGIYSQTCYKKALKDSVSDIKKRKPNLTLAKIASMLPVQSTFLSKALNDEKTHLNEDHLFRVGELLEMRAEEIDYLLLLRSKATAISDARREHLEKKIEAVRKEKVLSVDRVNASSDHLQNEMRYLSNPYCVLVHVALFIKEYEKQPLRLLPLLGITESQLKEILQVLEHNDLVVLGKGPFDLVEVKNVRPHRGPDHPWMRMHSQILKSNLIQQLSLTPEAEKDSFLVTFTMDEPTYTEVKKRFREFIQDVQKLTFDAKHKHLYQLSFDLMKWL